MKLAFDTTGDIQSISKHKIESVNASKSELGRFLFYLNVERGSYTYDQSFGNTVHRIIGLTNTSTNLKKLQKAFDDDLTVSKLFYDIDSNISVSSLGRSRVGVTIQGKGINATWELLSSAGRGASLVSYNDGTTFPDSEPLITEKKFKDFDDEKTYFDITSAYTECMNKNNITSLGDIKFNLRVFFLASATTEARLLNSFEYELSEGLEKREVKFHRPFTTNGVLTFQVWPEKSIVHQSSNQYLLRKKRTSNPTTFSNTY